MNGNPLNQRGVISGARELLTRFDTGQRSPFLALSGNPSPEGGRIYSPLVDRALRKLVHNARMRRATSEPKLLVCVSPSARPPSKPTASTFSRNRMNDEKCEVHHEGWRTLWLAIAGVMAITLPWNVLMLTFNGVSY